MAERKKQIRSDRDIWSLWIGLRVERCAGVGTGEGGGYELGLEWWKGWSGGEFISPKQFRWITYFKW